MSVVTRCMVAASFLFENALFYYMYIMCTGATMMSFLGMLLRSGTLKKLPKSRQAACIVSVAILASLPLFIESFRELSSGHLGVACLGTVRMAGLGILGGSIYAFHGPERWFPSCISRIGTSHQIMHVLVMGIPICELSFMLSMVQQERTCMISTIW